jgi:hypothetical protein
VLWSFALFIGLFAAAPALLLGQQAPAAASEKSSTSSQTEKSSPDAVSPDQESRSSGHLNGFWRLAPVYESPIVGAVPPPPTPGEAFRSATVQSFGAPSFFVAGLTSLGSDAMSFHPELGHGVRGFENRYWRVYLDKADGNYWTVFLLPTLLHEDNRYFVKGEGDKRQRALYAMSRVFVARDYRGESTTNFAELLGKGAAKAISLAYYPEAERTPTGYFRTYGAALSCDAVINIAREFWPDLSRRLRFLHSRE